MFLGDCPSHLFNVELDIDSDRTRKLKKNFQPFATLKGATLEPPTSGSWGNMLRIVLTIRLINFDRGWPLRRPEKQTSHAPEAFAHERSSTA